MSRTYNFAIVAQKNFQPSATSDETFLQKKKFKIYFNLKISQIFV